MVYIYYMFMYIVSEISSWRFQYFRHQNIINAFILKSINAMLQAR